MAIRVKRKGSSGCAALACAAVLAGCGQAAPDLFLLQRDGSIPGARLTLRVSDDGYVRCNHGARRRLSDPQLLQARESAHELDRLARRDTRLPAGSQPVLRYRLRLREGTIAFSDDSPRQPRQLFAVQAFTRSVAKQVCRLAR